MRFKNYGLAPKSAADFNADGRIDGIDLIEFVRQFGMDPRRCDLNADGVVIAPDMAIVRTAPLAYPLYSWRASS